MCYVIIGVCFAFLFLFLLNAKKRGAVLEYVAWFWFKFALVIALLFALNIFFSYVKSDFYLPINLFSVATITFLGIPGWICITFLMIMKKSY